MVLVVYPLEQTPLNFVIPAEAGMTRSGSFRRDDKLGLSAGMTKVEELRR